MVEMPKATLNQYYREYVSQRSVGKEPEEAAFRAASSLGFTGVVRRRVTREPRRPTQPDQE